MDTQRVSETEAERLLRDLYDRTWSACFDGRSSGLAKASVQIEFGEGTPGYSAKRDLIRIYIIPTDLEDLHRRSQGEDHWCRMGWHNVERELIHEMVHEYQHKLVGRASSEAEQLRRNSGIRWFDGDGHGDDFAEAIIQIARILGVAPEGLRDDI